MLLKVNPHLSKSLLFSLTVLTSFPDAGIGELDSSESQWDREDLKSSSVSKEISDLMRDLDYGSVNFQLNPAGHLFTRKLFLALEQIKASDRLSNGIQENPQLKCTDSLQRRLLFDAVNEVLVEKFVFQHSNIWLGKRKNNQHELLHGLCSEIDQLQAISLSCSSNEKDDGLRHIIGKDLSNQSVVWADGLSDISGVVLDIERLIFKDLVREVALGHVLRVCHASHCRQLF